MDLFFIIGLIALCFIAIGFIGYSVITKNIINDQEREIEELRHKIKLKDIKIDYLEKSRALYKAYFDSHKITIRSTDFTRSSVFDKAYEDALKANNAGLIIPTDYFEGF